MDSDVPPTVTLPAAPRTGNEQLRQAEESVKQLTLRMQQDPFFSSGFEQMQLRNSILDTVQEVRDKERKLFLDLFQQFPEGAEEENEEYTDIWESFRSKDSNTKALHDELRALTEKSSEVTSKLLVFRQ